MDYRKYLIQLAIKNRNLTKLQAYSKTNFELELLLGRVRP